MAKMTYAEQLRNPNWQRRRLEILSRSDFSCENCGDAESTLNVHHKYYRKGRMAWEYEDHELMALCESCHKQDHEHREVLDEILSELGYDQAVGILAGYAACAGNLTPKRAAEIFADHKREFVVGYLAHRIEWTDGELSKWIDALQRDMASYPEWANSFWSEKT